MFIEVPFSRSHACTWMADLPCYMWVSSLGNVRRGGIRVNADQEALTPSVVRALRSAGLPEALPADHRHIFALVRLDHCECFHAMSQLHSSVRQQVHFWQSLCESNLYGQAYRFDVTHVVPLPDGHRVQQLGGGKLRGFANLLEDGQGHRLLASFGATCSRVATAACAEHRCQNARPLC